MARFAGCLTSLAPQSQRVLSLRAGLHGRPRSAATTARILHLSPGRELLVEQASLVALQTAGSGGCAAGGTDAHAIGMAPARELVAATPALLTASSTSLPTLSSQPSASPTPGSSHAAAPGHDSSRPVVVIPAAKRTVERALAPTSSFPAVAIALFAALLLGTSLVLLPGIRGLLSPDAAAAPSGASDSSAPALAATAAVAPSANGPRPASSVELRPEPAGADPEPAGADPASVPAPEARSQNGQVAPSRGGSRAEWAREHATQAALVAGVIAGGAVRLLGRGRSRRS